MKRFLLLLFGLILLGGGGYYGFRYVQQQQRLAALGNLHTEAVMFGTLSASIGADGVVRSNQQAILSWQASGTAAPVRVQPGDQVSQDQILVSLEPSSLSQDILLAQSDLVAAQAALEQLLISNLQRAEAMQAVEDAQNALDAVLSPELAQANAQAALAAAQKNLETTERNLTILTNVPTQFVIQQARANLLLADAAIAGLQDQIGALEKRLARPETSYFPWESRSRYQQALNGLQVQLTQKQLSYEQAQQFTQSVEEPVTSPSFYAQYEVMRLARKQGITTRLLFLKKENAFHVSTSIGKIKKAANTWPSGIPACSACPMSKRLPTLCRKD